MHVFILCEDSYGSIFFKRFIKRLKNAGYLKINLNFGTDRLAGICNPKIERQIKANSHCNKIILIADAHGKSINEIESRLNLHIPEEFFNKVFKVVFPLEVEEWICLSLNITHLYDKPSKILKHRIGYEKYKLQNFADSLDLSRLEKDQIFTRLLQILNDP